MNKARVRLYYFFIIFIILDTSNLYGDENLTAQPVSITVLNETDEYQTIVVFLQEDSLNLMFDQLFPTAWQVFHLPPSQNGVKRKGVLLTDSSQSIGVVHYLESFLDLASPDYSSQQSAYNGALTIMTKAAWGEQFDYHLDSKGGQHLEQSHEDSSEQLITCRNKSMKLIDVIFYKNETRAAVWKDLATNDEARFTVKTVFSFMYTTQYKTGDIIKEKIVGNNVISVEARGYSSIRAILKYDPESSSRKKIWEIIKS